MIVPGKRLILTAGVLLLPLAVVITSQPQVAGMAKLAVSAVLIVLLADAATARSGLNGIQVNLPEIIRISKGREAQLELRIKNPGLKAIKLRLGLSFPEEITSSMSDCTAILEKDVFSSKITWPFTALKQGCYRLDRCYLETGSRLGLWLVRGSFPVVTEIRVYPDLLVELRNLHSLLRHSGYGVHMHRQIGKGKEFDHLREYLPGDSYEDIHWKACAKYGLPVTKVYQIERVQEIYMVLDASRLSARSGNPSTDTHILDNRVLAASVSTIMEKFITAALIMGIAAQRQGDAYGLLTFSDKAIDFVKAKSGKANYNICREILYTLEAQPVSPDFNELFTFIGNRLRRRALLVFLTNLDDPVLSESFAEHIQLISRQHLVVANMMRPESAVPLFTSPAESVNGLFEHLAGHTVWTGLKELGETLNRYGAGFNLLDEEKLCMQLVSRYLEIKQRQIL